MKEFALSTGEKEEIIWLFLHQTILNSLSYMVPNKLNHEGTAQGQAPSGRLSKTGFLHGLPDGNEPAHIMASILGTSLSLTIHEGKPLFGTCQKRQALLSNQRILVQAVGR